MVIDDDGTFHRQPGALRQADVRADASGDTEHVAGDSVPSANTIPVKTPSVLSTRVVIASVCTVMPMFSTERRRMAPAASVELGVHQGRGGVYHVDGQSPSL